MPPRIRAHKIVGLEGQLAGIQRSLNDRVAAAFMSGGSFSIGALLTSDSIQDAADRLQYTQSVVQGDADLATRVAVMAEELRRQETRLQVPPDKRRGVGTPRDAAGADRLSRCEDLKDVAGAQSGAGGRRGAGAGPRSVRVSLWGPVRSRRVPRQVRTRSWTPSATRAPAVGSTQGST